MSIPATRHKPYFCPPSWVGGHVAKPSTCYWISERTVYEDFNCCIGSRPRRHEFVCHCGKRRSERTGLHDRRPGRQFSKCQSKHYWHEPEQERQRHCDFRRV